MAEFEIHQLIHTARTEFDLGTFLLFIINFAFILLAVFAKEKLREREKNRLALACGVVSLFIIIRIIASIIRFAKMQELLGSMNPTFDHSFLLLQWPTLIGRIIILLGMPLLAIWFLGKKR